MAAHLSKPDAKCKAARQAEPVLKVIRRKCLELLR